MSSPFAIARWIRLATDAGVDHSALLQRCGHWGVDGPRLDGHDLHTRTREPVSKPLRKDAYRALGCFVHVVALPAAISCNRRDHRDRTESLLLNRLAIRVSSAMTLSALVVKASSVASTEAPVHSHDIVCGLRESAP